MCLEILCIEKSFNEIDDKLFIIMKYSVISRLRVSKTEV
jgi:hypothetical protein